MYNNKTILGFIPARGGSKGLPGKNLMDFSGRPLVAWTIENALKSKFLDKVIVSTDDAEIMEISRKYGAEVPFKRPKELSTDKAKIIDAIFHAVSFFKKKGILYDMVYLLQPTSPLRTSADIDAAIALLFKKKAEAVVSACETDHHPYWTNTLPRDNCMKNFINKKALNKNRQELSLFYRLNGAIYLAFCNYLETRKSFFGPKTFAYIMPKERSVDIDSAIDFRLAELLLKNSFNKS